MLAKLLNLFRRKRWEDEIQEELSFHQSQTTGPFGNAVLIKEQARDASTVVWLESLMRDIRYGFRQLQRAPVLVAVAIVSLALGIGANTAIFTLINAIMLQSLPVRDPGRLALLHDGINTGVYSGDSFASDSISFPSWQYLKNQSDPFESLCAFRQGNDRAILHLSGASESGTPERVNVHLVSENYFQVLGVKAASGRLLQEGDDLPGAPPAAVISYRFWDKRFQSKQSVIGQAVVLNGTGFTIVGVAAREFFGERVQAPPDFWLPLPFQAQILGRESWLAARDVYWLNLLGRLKPGVTIQNASAVMTTQLRNFYSGQAGTILSESTKRKIRDFRVNLKPGGSGISGLRYLYSQPLRLLMAVVGMVLLIACANISTLLLARASAREREFSARLALGASRGRLTRQVLTESVLLSGIAGIAAIAVAWGSVKGLMYLLSVDSVVKVRPNTAVLAFTSSISILTGVLFGIIPALRFRNMDLRVGITAASRGSARRKVGSAHSLIALQVALSFVLLLGTGLLAHSLIALESQDLGFTHETIIIVRTDPRLAGFKKNQLLGLYRNIDERLNQIPGVSSASLARYTPISGNSSSGGFAIQGGATPAGSNMDLYRVEVGPRFFETLGIPLRSGRSIGPRDTPASAPIAVVNEAFVAKYLAGQQPIGKRFSLGSPFHGPGFEIVGVAADSKYYDLREAAKPMAFLAAWQFGGDDSYAGDLVLRTSVPASGIMPQVRSVLSQISNKLPILNVTTLNHQVEESLYQQKLLTGLCSVFGILALFLACIGIYGTAAYATARRTTEIGIRMAMGAQRRTVLWMVLRESILLIAVGLAIGFPLALAATRWIKSFLYTVPSLDPAAAIGAAVLIASASLIAAYLPASQATKIDPMIALRYE